MEAGADYQYAPLRIPPGTSRSAAATLLSLQADTGGWELARLQLHADGTRRVILRSPRWPPTGDPPPPRPALVPAGTGSLDARTTPRDGVHDTARGRGMGERPTLI